jgi:hypothetical protein
VPMLEYHCPRLPPLLYAVSPWEITVSSAAGSLLKRLQWKCTLVCGPGPTHRNRPRPAHSQIFQSRYSLKKLARTAYKFNHGSGPRVKLFLLRINVDFKNRSFKTVDQTNFKHSSGSYGLRHPPICFSDKLFS